MSVELNSHKTSNPPAKKEMLIEPWSWPDHRYFVPAYRQATAIYTAKSNVGASRQQRRCTTPGVSQSIDASKQASCICIRCRCPPACVPYDTLQQIRVCQKWWSPEAHTVASDQWPSRRFTISAAKAASIPLSSSSSSLLRHGGWIED
jgi:hypothetical protein